MITVKKYTGRLKGFNIRQTNDGKFHIYKGIVSQTQTTYNTKEEAEYAVKYQTYRY